MTTADDDGYSGYGDDPDAEGQSRSASAYGYGTYGSTNDDDSFLLRNGTHLRLHIWKYTGDFYIRTQHEYAPIKLVAPYMYFNQTAYQTEVMICDMEVGSHFLGLLGGELCGVYDVYAETFQGDCHELETHTVVSDTTRATELAVDHFARGSVASGGFEDYYVYVDEDRGHDNLIIELEVIYTYVLCRIARNATA